MSQISQPLKCASLQKALDLLKEKGIDTVSIEWKSECIRLSYPNGEMKLYYSASTPDEVSEKKAL